MVSFSIWKKTNQSSERFIHKAQGLGSGEHGSLTPRSLGGALMQQQGSRGHAVLGLTAWGHLGEAGSRAHLKADLRALRTSLSLTTSPSLSSYATALTSVISFQAKKGLPSELSPSMWHRRGPALRAKPRNGRFTTYRLSPKQRLFSGICLLSSLPCVFMYLFDIWSPEFIVICRRARWQELFCYLRNNVLKKKSWIR